MNVLRMGLRLGVKLSPGLEFGVLTENVEIEEAKNGQEIFRRNNIIAWLKS